MTILMFQVWSLYFTKHLYWMRKKLRKSFVINVSTHYRAFKVNKYKKDIYSIWIPYIHISSLLTWIFLSYSSHFLYISSQEQAINAYKMYKSHEITAHFCHCISSLLVWIFIFGNEKSDFNLFFYEFVIDFDLNHKEAIKMCSGLFRSRRQF